MKRLLTVALTLMLLACFACSQPLPEAEGTGEPLPELTADLSQDANEEERAATEEIVVTPEPESTPMPDMEVTSTGIVDGEMGLDYGMHGNQFNGSQIPSLSLPLMVNNIPAGTKTLAITMIDPDGGNWVHWLVCNIIVEETSYELKANASIDMADSFVQGKNDFGPIGYGGPTPPSGVHTYVMTVYALSDMVALDNGFTQQDLEAAMDSLILAQAVVTGSYAR